MIRVTDDAEFGRLLKALADDIVDAHIHYRLYRDLLSAIEVYPLVAHQSNTFWSTTLKAHLATSMFTLARVYDQEQSSLHLPNFLRTIKGHPELFSESNFRRRKIGNPNLDELANEGRFPSAEILDEDIFLCSPRDPLVHKLTVHRGQAIAHRSGRNTAKGRSVSDSFPLTLEEYEILLARAKETLNRYSLLFEASIYSTRPIGADDYDYIFKCVTQCVEQSLASCEQDLSGHSIGPDLAAQDGTG